MLKYIVLTLAFVTLVLLAGCNIKAGGLEIRDPVREAEATRVAITAQDESARRAVERSILEAQADKAHAGAQAERNALPAATLRNALIYTGIGVGVLVLAVGSAFAIVAWLNKRATSVYPNCAGQYPVIVKRSWNGVTIVHDPNRALGPTTIYTTPSVVGQLLRQSQTAQAQFPQPGSEEAVRQITTQAQAGQVMAALAHGARGNPSLQQAAADKIVHAADPKALMESAIHPQLPPITVITDPQEVARFKQVYVLEAQGSELYE